MHTYICTYILYMHTFICTYIYTYIHTYMHTHIQCIHTYCIYIVHTYIHTYIHTYMRVFRHPIMVFSTIDSEASAPPRYMPPLNIPADTDKYDAYDVRMYVSYV